MPSTYLSLVNQVLEQLNEVPLTEISFSSARGIHASAKNSVKYAIRKINATKFEWPFNHGTKTQVLTAGQVEYTWPTDFKKPDWNSFQLQKNDTLATGAKQLQFIKRDDYFHYFRDEDSNSVTGRTVPIYVFEAHGTSFGVTPSPNQAYTVVYKYWKHPTDLTLYSDTTTIPSEFDYVIVAGGLAHLKTFKNDFEGYQATKAEFQDGIKDMTQIFLSTDTYMSDTRVDNSYNW